MVFSSLLFVVYFLPISLIVYYLLGFSVKIQNIWLLLISLFFYAWGEPVYVLLMIGSILLNWIFGLIVGKSIDKSPIRAKVTLIISIIFNVGTLVVFKYVNFIVDNINGIIGREAIGKVDLALPIGISFFTFQAMSYVIDIYRKDAKYQKNPFYMGLYISFFPQLVAGPIVRYNTIEEYILSRKVTFDDFVVGINRFAIGLIKKVVIANNVAIITDKIYELVNTGRLLYEVSAVMAWIGAIGYMLQIFYDFSAYSDMAIGLGRCFGFRFDENFNYPYMSKSIGEFWRRWHISLGTWFKEYIYIPLGGSREENQDMMVKNTFIVWLLTGLWHGASWTFIAWGLLHFLFIILERAFGFEKAPIPSAIKRIYTLIVVLFGWVLFRVENLYQLREMVKDMFMANKNCFINDTTVFVIKEYAVFFLLGFLFSTPIFRKVQEGIVNGKNKAVRAGLTGVYIVVICIGLWYTMSSLVRGGYNPFIYFNF